MKYFLLLPFAFATVVLLGQTGNKDIVYLKNGSIIKGTVIKNFTDSTTAVQTPDGNLFVYKKSEVRRILVDNRTSSSKANNLWVGLNFEPQFQNIFKSQRNYQNYIAQNPGGNIQLPGSGGFQLGLMLDYYTSGVAGFGTGLQYHFYQNKEILSLFYYGIPETETYINRFNSIEIPVFISLRSKGDRVRFFSRMGISAGVILGTSHYISVAAPGYTTKDTSFSRGPDSTTFIYCTLLFSAGVQLSLPSNILLNLTGSFRLSANGPLGATNPFFAPNPYPFFPYSFGLSVEVFFPVPHRTRSTNGGFMIGEQQPTFNRQKFSPETWNPATLILINGDSLKVKVRKCDGYTQEDVLFPRGKLLFANADGSEEKVDINNLKELYIPALDSGYRKYITVAGTQEYANRKAYRVVIDGKCQMLSSNITGTSQPAETENITEKFYLFYKENLIQINPKTWSRQGEAFMSKNKEFFGDCPKLTQKTGNDANYPRDLGELLREFNQCITSH